MRQYVKYTYKGSKILRMKIDDYHEKERLTLP